MIDDKEFQAAADVLKCDVAAIKAVAEVESTGSGFNADGTCKVLFEGHHFHRLTGGRFDADHPDLSYPRWTHQFYGKTQDAEWDRLDRAMALDHHAALQSTSWGRFQIMGFNCSACGYEDVESFVDAVERSEASQLGAFVRFILHDKVLLTALRERRWADFGKRYNGPGYDSAPGRENDYDTRLEHAYARHSAPAPASRTRTAATAGGVALTAGVAYISTQPTTPPVPVEHIDPVRAEFAGTAIVVAAAITLAAVVAWFVWRK